MHSAKTQTSARVLAACALASVAALSCGGPASFPQNERYDYDEGTTLDVADSEQLLTEYTDTPYDFTGPTPIADVVALTESDDFVWQGFDADSAFPVSGDCEADRQGDQAPQIVDELPVTIEGVVTLHPRYFQKHAICGQDERFYGSFFIQDASGGILVLRDSRVAKFTFGNRVRLKVRGLMSNRFGEGFRAVLAYDDFEVLPGEGTDEDPLYLRDKYPIYYEEIDRELEGSDIGLVKRFTGVVTREADNNNFSELRLESEDGSKQWVASLDREIALRRPPLDVGTRVTLTGPVIDSFGLRVLVASYGQLEIHD
jgi:hypothetical protein